jgi:hypothetical protein
LIVWRVRLPGCSEFTSFGSGRNAHPVVHEKPPLSTTTPLPNPLSRLDVIDTVL